MSEKRRLFKEIKEMINHLDENQEKKEICPNCGNIMLSIDTYCNRCGGRKQGKPSIKISKITFKQSTN